MDQLQNVQRQLEIQRQEMEQLLYTVSHDLRSPLVTIEGFTNMLEQHLASGDLDQAVDDLARVKRATRTMTSLLRDLLQLSRVNRQGLSLADVNVHEVAAEAAANLELALRAAGAALSVQADLPMVRADRSQLLQTLVNLVGNAIKYGCPTPGGTITIGGERRGGEVLLFVKDNGPGIDAVHHEKIFELFKRLDVDVEGTGVGLAIVKRIMNLHDGRVWVTSTPGEGATFWLAFPAPAGETGGRQCA